ncbi:serine hydrolase domain-containing protein [Parapedobacter sp. GCM10030251]|uniref:serine hydrolase domain-containing protein n=1 Tax=Parapedobacter sp. GCM10030251 TaxID=3273419 RepID=UPI00366ED4BB
MIQMKIFGTFLLAAAVSMLAAQTPSIQKSAPLTEAAPANVGISPDRLKWIDEMLQQSVSDGQIPGAVALIARNGKIVYHKAFGTADAQTGRKQKVDDIFRIASQTKAITATAVMMLWEEGRFQLDDPISKYIPEFKSPKVLQSFRYTDTSFTTRPANKEITIRHLLTHTSGLGYGVIDGDERMKLIYQKAGTTDLFTTADVSIGSVVEKLAKLPLHHDPGEKFTYSMGLDVLGYLVEVVSGLPFDRFLKERLFDPLGMTDTWFYLPKDKADRLVAVQYRKDGQWANYPKTFYDPDYPVTGARKFFAGGAGLVGSAKDYATFLQMYLNGGELNGVRILSRTTVASILANQVGNLMGTDQYYGLAFGVLTEQGSAKGGQGSQGTFTWGGYFNTQYFADPKEQTIGILMKQTQGPVDDQTAWKFRQLVATAIDD